jgi:hypothetical protein
LGDEPLHHPGVLGDGVAIPGRSRRQTEARVVKGDAAEPVLEAVDDVPVQDSTFVLFGGGGLLS